MAHLLAEVIVGALLTLLLLVAKGGFEHTVTSHWLEESFFELLQLRLASDQGPAAHQVVVVDIANLPMVRHPTDRRLDYTNRNALRALVEKLVQQRPRAIGLDLDFTPYSAQRSDDRAFLDFCLRPGHRATGSPEPAVPIFVGLYNSVALGPDLCLDESRFAPLAAFAGFPTVGDEESRKRLVESLVIDYQDNAGQLRRWRCPALAAAVTQSHVGEPPRLLAGLLNRRLFFRGTGFIAQNYLVDYGPLESIEQNAVAFEGLDSYLAKSFFQGKYVLLGRSNRGDSSGDRFPIPGRHGRSHAGVFVHACGIYTLLRGALFEPSTTGRIALDVILSAFVVFGAALCRYLGHPPQEELEDPRTVDRVTTIAVGLVLLLGFFTVNVTRLLWDDFAVVAAALLIHRSLESRTAGLSRRLAHSLSAARAAAKPGRPPGKQRRPNHG